MWSCGLLGSNGHRYIKEEGKKSFVDFCIRCGLLGSNLGTVTSKRRVPNCTLCFVAWSKSLLEPDTVSGCEQLMSTEKEKGSSGGKLSRMVCLLSTRVYTYHIQHIINTRIKH